MRRARTGHTLTTLNDDSVLVIGGHDDNREAIADIERFDPVRGQWEEAGSLLRARHGHAATVMGDGRILVSGGIGPTEMGSSQVLAETEIYDPKLRQTLPGPALAHKREGHLSVATSSNDLWIVGGRDYPTGNPSSTTEILRAGAAAFTAGPSLSGAYPCPTAWRDGDGLILVDGRRRSAPWPRYRWFVIIPSRPLRPFVERIDFGRHEVEEIRQRLPATLATFTSGDSIGYVVAMTPEWENLANVERGFMFDARRRTFREVPPPPQPVAQLVALPDGSVVALATVDMAQTRSDAARFDGTKWADLPPPPTIRRRYFSTVMRGRVLVAGGKELRRGGDVVTDKAELLELR